MAVVNTWYQSQEKEISSIFESEKEHIGHQAAWRFYLQSEKEIDDEYAKHFKPGDIVKPNHIGETLCNGRYMPVDWTVYTGCVKEIFKGTGDNGRWEALIIWFGPDKERLPRNYRLSNLANTGKVWSKFKP